MSAALPLHLLEHCPALLIAPRSGLTSPRNACKGGTIAMKIESKAEYMGTVMKELTLFKILPARVLKRPRKDRKRDEGGPEGLRRRRLGSSP
jgi:hypothetical protein